MAARSDAAATPGPKNGVFMSVSLVSSSSNCLTLLKNQKTNTRKHIYDRQSLLDIDNVYKHQLSPATTEKLQGLCLLLKPDPETAASPTDATRTKRRRRRCERGQKRGKRGGIRARLRANPTSPAIPSLMLSNVRSLENKLDLIQCRPFYLPREFTAIVIVAVLLSSRLAVNRGSRLDFTPRPTLFFLPAGFCCLVSSIEETPSARLSKLENYGFDQLVSQRD